MTLILPLHATLDRTVSLRAFRSYLLTNSRLFHIFCLKYFFIWGRGGYTVAQLIEALRNKSEGRGFDSRWYHWNFSLM